MKRVTRSHQTDHVGMLAVAQKVHKGLGWIFRPQTPDYGIDALIEVVTDCLPTGKIIAAQVKSGTSYFRNLKPDAITFRGQLQHLDYWLKHDLSVIVILYDPASDVAYWQSVTEEHITRT